MRAVRRVILLACGAFLLLGMVTAVGDDEPVPPEQLAKEAVKAFRKAYRNKDPKARCDALLVLSMTQHEIVVREIGRALRKERSRKVVEAGALVLGDMKDVPEEAGAVLRTLIRVRRKDPEAKELLRVMATSIGKLRYRGAHDELVDLLGYQDQWVVVAAIEAIGEVGDKKALPELFRMASLTGDFFVQESRDATGDPRPAIPGDRQKAERKAAAGQTRRVYAEVVKLYSRHLREAVKKLTGEEFETLAEFEAWLEEHPEEIGRKSKRAGRGR